MEELREGVRILAVEELERANKLKSLFTDEHHGWAVILEESIEAKQNMNKVENGIKDLFVNIMNNQSTSGDALVIRYAAIELACEAIQVAAMAKKYVDSLANKEGDECAASK